MISPFFSSSAADFASYYLLHIENDISFFFHSSFFHRLLSIFDALVPFFLFVCFVLFSSSSLSPLQDVTVAIKSATWNKLVFAQLECERLKRKLLLPCVVTATGLHPERAHPAILCEKLITANREKSFFFPSFSELGVICGSLLCPPPYLIVPRAGLSQLFKNN